jgi:hypothetical protein
MMHGKPKCICITIEQEDMHHVRTQFFEDDVAIFYWSGVCARISFVAKEENKIRAADGIPAGIALMLKPV